MIYIAHRVNTIVGLKSIPENCGVEVDLRDRGDQLILQHEPFSDGEPFEEYLREYRHRLMILNVKSERIEQRVLDLIRKYRIKNYFFLDCSFPMMRQLISLGETQIAVRFSEVESIETVFAFQGVLQWVWVDCFKRSPLDAKNYALLKKAGFRLCLVSPELQGRPQDILQYAQYLVDNRMLPDAVCTKKVYTAQWQQIFSLGLKGS